MRKLLTLLSLTILLVSCDDGDIITVAFDFEDTFSTCGELVLYKFKNDPAESLSISLDGVTEDDLTAFDEVLENVVVEKVVLTRTLNGNSNKFNYRRYNGTIVATELFCNAIPSNLDITSDDESTTGTVIITTTVIEDDNDGIPWEDEDENTDGDNNPATNPTDTDNDGVPNYLDLDDDGDNVLTKDEDLNTDDDDNPFTNALDSDGDGIPDYLDTDDDGDDVLTRDEENFVVDNNPRNDETNSGEGPDYLNPLVSTTVPATAFRPHQVTRSYTISVNLTNINLSNLTQDALFFGIKTASEVITRETLFN